MTHKVSVSRRWREPPPIGRDGKPIPKQLWPRRRKHVWCVRWFAIGPDGKTRRPSREFGTRAEAESFRAQKQAEFNQSPHTRAMAAKTTLREFINEFTELKIGPRGQRLRPATLAIALQSLERLSESVGENRPIAEVRPADAARLFAQLRDEESLAPPTVNKIKRALKAAFSVAVSPMGIIQANPLSKIRADRVTNKTIRYVSAQEVSAILSACENLWWQCALTVCYMAGLRYSELIHLGWGDVDFANDTLRVSAKLESQHTLAWAPKDYESRTIPVPPRAMNLLAEMQQSATEGHAYVFLPADRLAIIKAAKAAGLWKAGRYELNNFHRSFRAILLRAAKKTPSLADSEGKPTVHLHDLRRSAITNWSKVANMQTVMAMAGHSNIETTQRYYAAATDDQLDRVRQASDSALELADLWQNDAKVTQIDPVGDSGPTPTSAEVSSDKHLGN